MSNSITDLILTSALLAQSQSKTSLSDKEVGIIIGGTIGGLVVLTLLLGCCSIIYSMWEDRLIYRPPTQQQVDISESVAVVVNNVS